MSNRITSISAPAPAFPRFVTAALLAASFVALGGCNANTAPLVSPQATRYAPDNQLRGMQHRTDPARNRIWILTSEGVSLQVTGSPGKSVEIVLPSWQWVDEPYGCPPDLALGPDGEVVVTSNIVPVLWRIDPDSLAVSVHEIALDADKAKDVGFSGLAYSVEHGEFVAVSDVHGSLWRIDALLRTGRKVSGPSPTQEACGTAAHAASRVH
jgi:hypothetical protein